MDDERPATLSQKRIKTTRMARTARQRAGDGAQDGQTREIVPVKADRAATLKDVLDAIDERTACKVVGGYYEPRLNILIGMWEKGRAIAARFTGVKCVPSYRELERETEAVKDLLTAGKQQKKPGRGDGIEVRSC